MRTFVWAVVWKLIVVCFAGLDLREHSIDRVVVVVVWENRRVVGLRLASLPHGINTLDRLTLLELPLDPDGTNVVLAGDPSKLRGTLSSAGPELTTEQLDETCNLFT